MNALLPPFQLIEHPNKCPVLVATFGFSRVIKTIEMRPFINLMIIVCLPLMFFSVYDGDNMQTSVETKVQPSVSNYCNSRFNFCVIYPSIILPVQEVSVNDDGVNLKTANEKSSVSVNGSYNILNWTPSDLYQFTLRSVTDDDGEAEIISHIIGEDYVECYFIHDKMAYYNRSFFVDDYYVSLIIQVPVNDPVLMQQLRDEVSLTFGANQG